MRRIRVWCDNHLHNSLNPFYWDEPAGLNVVLMTLGLIVALYVFIWLCAWFGFGVVYSSQYIPWPSFD